jgi:aspartate dehydrogenase
MMKEIVMKKFRLALIGGGYLNGIVAKAVKDGILPEYELVAVLGRSSRTEAFAKEYGCKACYTIEELLAEKPDYTSEAAGGNAIRSYGKDVLRGGSNLIIISAGAFADEELYNQIQEEAKLNNRKVYISSGAVGGFDVLRTASLMSPIKVSITSLRSPMAIYYSPVSFEGILEIEKPTEVYRGTTKEAIALFPHGVNVAVATALASAGPENTHIDIHAVPGGFRGDEFQIRLEGEEVATDLRIYSRTCAIAGWSIVATLKNIASPIEFF